MPDKIKGEEQVRLTEKAAARQKRQEAARQRLEKWASAHPTTTEDIRKHLQAFLKIGITNDRDFLTRKRTVRKRLERSDWVPSRESLLEAWQGRRNLPKESRWQRRAENTGDMAKAIEIANRFHKNCRPLYVSRRGRVQYGKGGQVEHGLRRSWKYPAPKWQNAGVRIDYDTGSIILENHKGQIVSTLNVPLKRVTFEGIQDTDLWGIRLPNGYVEPWHANGVAFPVSR